MLVLVLPDVIDDVDLLQRARQKNREAVAMIYERYMEPIYQFVRLRVGDAQTAEDITATVFLKMIRAFKEGKGPRTHLRGWLFRVARNAIYDQVGEEAPLPIDTIDQWFAAPDEANPEIQVLKALDRDAIRRFILQLTPDQQEVLLLRFDQQLSLREVADITGKAVGTVKTLQFRAVRRLRTLANQQGIGG